LTLNCFYINILEILKNSDKIDRYPGEGVKEVYTNREGEGVLKIFGGFPNFSKNLIPYNNILKN
jgi:hypothetical protein